MLSFLKKSCRVVSTVKPKKVAPKVQTRGLFVLPKLPFRIEKGLAPLLSPHHLNIHYNQIHLSYLVKANQLVEPTKYELMPLDTIVRRSSGKLEEAPLNTYVSQAWNHTFMWQCMTPMPQQPSDMLKAQFKIHFDGFNKFKTRFTQYAMALNGSGYTWLVDVNGKWEIMNTFGAQSALSLPDTTPLLVLDLWEHAYYGDYEDRRAEYIENWWKVVNWSHIEDQFLKIDRSKTYLFD